MRSWKYPVWPFEEGRSLTSELEQEMSQSSEALPGSPARRPEGSMWVSMCRRCSAWAPGPSATRPVTPAPAHRQHSPTPWRRESKGVGHVQRQVPGRRCLPQTPHSSQSHTHMWGEPRRGNEAMGLIDLIRVTTVGKWGRAPFPREAVSTVSSAQLSSAVSTGSRPSRRCHVFMFPTCFLPPEWLSHFH